MKYLIVFSYDGSLFHGFQRQNNVKNVQGTLESVLTKYLGTPTLIKGSGRTDAGVHALRQGAHFYSEKKLGRKDKNNINKLLNGEVVIKKIKQVNDGFHARKSVLEKSYVYKINMGKYNEELSNYCYQVKYKLDVKKMRKASKLFLGVHDFHNFVSGKRDSYETIIYKISIKKRKNFLEIKFVGAGFYRYMVRHLVGALVDVGKSKLSIEELAKMINNKDYYKESSCVIANGLYLTCIKFDFDNRV